MSRFVYSRRGWLRVAWRQRADCGAECRWSAMREEEMAMGDSVAKAVVGLVVKVALVVGAVLLAFIAAIFDLARKSR